MERIISNIELVGISEAIEDFNRCDEPANIYFDANTGDVWAATGNVLQSSDAFCVLSKPLFSATTITEEELCVACNRQLSILAPNYND